MRTHGLPTLHQAPIGYFMSDRTWVNYTISGTRWLCPKEENANDLYTLYQAPIGWSVLDRRECMLHLITSSTDCLIYVRQKGTHGLFTFFQPPTGYSLSHRSDQFIHTMSDTRCLIYVRRKENIIGLTTLYQVHHIAPDPWAVLHGAGHIGRERPLVSCPALGGTA